MDIKCERCGTEYEFDDSRVTEDGVSVKCSSCGHLFRISKKSVGPVQPLAQEPRFRTDLVGKNRLWMVRKPDGTVLVFKELAVLQKWIGEDKIFRDDEISRTGESWKRLGDIPELASFFSSFDQTKSQPAHYSPPSSPPVPPQSLPPLPVHLQGAPSFAVSSPSNPALPMGSGLTTTPPPVVSSPSAPPVMLAHGNRGTFSGSRTPPALGLGVQASPVVVSHPPMRSVMSMPTMTTIQNDRSEPDSWGDLESTEVEEDVVEKWKRRGRRKWFFIGPLALIVIGIGVGYVLAPVEFKKMAGKAIGIAMEDASPAAQTRDKLDVDEKKNSIDDDAKTESMVSEKSVESVKPIEPRRPSEPAEPIGLTKSVEPVKPSEPAKPIAPAKPTTYDGWMSLADRLQRANRTKEALAAYDAALNLKDEDVEALTGKGQCLMDIGAYPAAMALFERALKVHPRFGDALIGLAEANKRQGSKREALIYYQKYIDLMPDGPDAALAIENINELKKTQ